MKIASWGFRFRHLVMGIAVLCALIVGLYIFVAESDAYAQAVYFARTNPAVAKRVGHVSRVHLRFWDGFHITQGDAAFVLGVGSETDESILDVRLKRFANSWRVEDAYLTTKTEAAVRVASGLEAKN